MLNKKEINLIADTMYDLLPKPDYSTIKINDEFVPIQKALEQIRQNEEMNEIVFAHDDGVFATTLSKSDDKFIVSSKNTQSEVNELLKALHNVVWEIVPF